MKAGLEEIVARKKADLAKRRERIPFAALEKEIPKVPAPRDFKKALSAPGVSVIGELKKASPSAGIIRPGFDPAKDAAAYERAGARALSVLTEENFFLGELKHIGFAKAATKLPVLRKDFIVEAYQIHEARVYGADAVLLIVALLKDAELKELMGAVEKLGMTALVEAHDKEELLRAAGAGASVIGVNSRNLKDLSMNPRAFEELVPLAPKGSAIVAESGIKTAEDVKRIKALGVKAILVGESLLKEKDLESAAKILVDAAK